MTGSESDGDAAIETAVPDFALTRLGQILTLSVTRSPAGELIVDIQAAVRDAPPGVVARLRMVGARGRLPEVDGWFGVSELLVDDLAGDQLEGVRYRVHDEGGDLNIYCRDLQVWAS